MQSDSSLVPAYDFIAPQRIVFGWGRRSELPTLAAELGCRAWLVAGSRTLDRNGTLSAVQNALRERGIAVELVAQITHEPEVTDVDELVEHRVGRPVHVGLDTTKADPEVPNQRLKANRMREQMQRNLHRWVWLLIPIVLVFHP